MAWLNSFAVSCAEFLPQCNSSSSQFSIAPQTSWEVMLVNCVVWMLPWFVASSCRCVRNHSSRQYLLARILWCAVIQQNIWMVFDIRSRDRRYWRGIRVILCNFSIREQLQLLHDSYLLRVRRCLSSPSIFFARHSRTRQLTWAFVSTLGHSKATGNNEQPLSEIDQGTRRKPTNYLVQVGHGAVDFAQSVFLGAKLVLMNRRFICAFTTRYRIANR